MKKVKRISTRLSKSYLEAEKYPMTQAEQLATLGEIEAVSVDGSEAKGTLTVAIKIGTQWIELARVSMSGHPGETIYRAGIAHAIRMQDFKTLKRRRRRC